MKKEHRNSKQGAVLYQGKRWLAIGLVSCFGFTFLATLLGGCSQPQVIKLEGRWSEQRTDTFLEFTPSGLCAEINKYPREVICYRYRYDKDVLKLDPISQPWPIVTRTGGLMFPPVSGKQFSAQMANHRLVLEQSGKTRKFDRLQEVPKLNPEVGLWVHSMDSKHRDYYEFTPYGTMVSAFWNRLDSPYREKIGPICEGQWHRYKLAGDSIEFDGFSVTPQLCRCKGKVTFSGSDKMSIQILGAKLELTRLKELPSLEGAK